MLRSQPRHDQAHAIHRRHLHARAGGEVVAFDLPNGILDGELAAASVIGSFRVKVRPT